MAKKPTQSAALVPFDPENLPRVGDYDGKYKVKRRVTVPLLSLTYNNQLKLLIEGEISASNSSMAVEGKDKPMAVCPVVNLETGESMTLIVPTVLESALHRVPGGYVGKKFLVIQGPKMPNKRYFQVELFELEG